MDGIVTKDVETIIISNQKVCKFSKINFKDFMILKKKLVVNIVSDIVTLMNVLVLI